MLPLLERVVGHLERVRRVADKEVVEREVRPDVERFERFVIELFERKAGDDPQSATRLDDYYWCWEPRYLRAFVNEFYWGLLDSAGAGWGVAERASFIELGLGHASSLIDPVLDEGLSRPRARTLVSLVDATRDTIGNSAQSWDARCPWNIAGDYCERVGLCIAASAGTVVTPAGATAIRLRGRDRLRWLLALETSLASSGHDPWCVDLDSVRHLARGSLWSSTEQDVIPISTSTMERWREFGALQAVRDPHGAADGYQLTSVGRELFGELERDDATSFRILARALLEDDREAVLARGSSTDGSFDRATEATLRHARLVAHEVRNALLPVEFALKKVWNSPPMAAAGLEDSRRRVDDGLARLHRFIDDSLRLTPLAEEAVTQFSVIDAIEEARRECMPSPEGGISIEMIPASVVPECRGHQGRFVLALLNLLRNAVQIGGQRIWISIDARSIETLVIRVRDDGPGVPEERRDTLFEHGVSHRSDGSGHGLSFVRLVVEQEMGGRVQLVSPRDERGACFELRLPVPEDAR